MKSVRDATQETISPVEGKLQERPFWVYMGMLAILIFVRLTFYIFHLMFPTYAIRVFGADFPVASIFGTLNPVMIIFLVPINIGNDHKCSVLHDASLGYRTLLHLCFCVYSRECLDGDCRYMVWNVCI